MFSIWSHFFGAVTVRIHRFFLNFHKQPDAVLIYSNLYFGGFSSLTALKKIGINSIVDLTENQLNKNISRKFSMKYFSLPIPDRGTPTISDVLKTVEWIESQLKNQDKVFVHCNLGRGRGPLITALYLIYIGMNSNNVLTLLKKKRTYVFLNHNQLKFINLFEKKINQ